MRKAALLAALLLILGEVLASGAALAAGAALAQPVHRKTGKAIFIGSQAGAPVAAGHAGIALAPGEAATPERYLQAYGAAFGLAQPLAETRRVRERADGRGRSSRFRQHYRGLPVIAGEIVVNVDAR